MVFFSVYFPLTDAPSWWFSLTKKKNPDGVLSGFFVVLHKPTNGVFVDVAHMLLVIFLISDDMVIIPRLPYISAVFSVAEPLECRNEQGKGRVCSCRRDRRPRLSLLPHLKKYMNMVRHNDKTVYRNVVVKCIHFPQIFFSHPAIGGKFHFGTGVPDCPYDIRKNILPVLGAHRNKIHPGCVVIIPLQSGAFSAF